MNTLVTGASGFVGRHLLTQLFAQPASVGRVLGTVHQTPIRSLASDFPGGTFLSLDMLDGAAVQNAIAHYAPELCFHLAGISSVDTFAKQPAQSMRINVEGWIHLLEAFKAVSSQSLIVLVSSAQVYGQASASALPIAEDALLDPENLYSVSKAACEGIAQSYARHFGLRILVLRPFNHIGPGQSTSFVCSSLAKQVAQIEAGLVAPVIVAGNMESRRDFTDVRDIIRAYLLSVNRCQVGQPYNVCSGQATAISEILDRLIFLAGLRTKVQIETTRKRTLDPPLFYGSTQKFHTATGWTAQIPLDKTLKDTLDYWRCQVKVTRATV